MSRPIRQELARRLSPTDNRIAKKPTQSFPGGLGTVAAVNMDGTIGVTYNGAVIPCHPVANYAATVGDPVLVVIVGTINFAWGPVSAVPDFTGSAFLNSWTNFGSGTLDAGFRRIGDKVELRGCITGGSNNTVAFVLPDDCIPQGIASFSCNAFDFSTEANVGGWCSVDTSGNVTVGFGSGATALFLDGINFSIL